MVNEKYLALGTKRSVIRELFEYGRKRKAEIGEDKVFDFSLGNPSIEPPASLNSSIVAHLEHDNALSLHGYTSAQGDAKVRKTIADSIKQRFGFEISPDLIYMTCGAAASLTISLSAICVEGDSVLTFAPYFPEYAVFSSTAGAKFAAVEPNADMGIDFDNLKKCLNRSVKAVIINSPNNPSGVVYDKKTLETLCDILREKEAEYGHAIYLISDEPYRELTYGAEVPYLMNLYNDVIVCYSYSKSLSIPGDRIGYIAVSPNAKDASDVYFAVCGAGRALGYVCAPSLMQKVIADCVYDTSDVEKYRENRDILCAGLSECGYEFAKPDGAFYLFVKAPSGDGDEFSERAKKHEILLVSGRGFGAPTHARIAYCVDKQTIVNSLPAFKALMEEYK